MTTTTTTTNHFVCPECGEGFRRQAGLGGHRRARHGIIGTSKTAKQFRRLHSGNGDNLEETPTPRVLCSHPGCNRTFATRPAMFAHRTRMHRGETNGFASLDEEVICPDCGKQLKNKRTLYAHRRYMHTKAAVLESVAVQTEVVPSVTKLRYCPSCGIRVEKALVAMPNFNYCPICGYSIVNVLKVMEVAHE